MVNEEKNRLVGFELADGGEVYISAITEYGDIHLHRDKKRALRFTAEDALYYAVLLGIRGFILHPVGSDYIRSGANYDAT